MKQASRPNSHPLWRDGIAPLSLPAVTSEFSCDVAIIGAGFSGLWSAYHLLILEPSLQIAIFESHEVGFGASGRNGGWVSADYPVDRKTLLRRYPTKDVDGFAALLRKGVDEIGAIASNISPNSGFRKSGSLLFAMNDVQCDRLKDSVDAHHHLLTGDEVRSKVNLLSARGGLFAPDCATVNPRRLLIDLAQHLTMRGVAIYENSPALHHSRNLIVNGYPIDAKWVIRATEAFSKKSREQIPLYSLMIATRALTDAERAAIGWSPGLAIAEATHNVNYAQLAPDLRMAVGGRGARYPYASRLDVGMEANTETHHALQTMIHNWFDQLGALEITHHWGGAIAIRRNWESRIKVDQECGLAELGGYVGDGMTMSFIAARSIAERIITGNDPLRDMPISSGEQRMRRWPVEPFRYLGANALILNIRLLDRAESRGKRGRLLKALMRLIGRTR